MGGAITKVGDHYHNNYSHLYHAYFTDKDTAPDHHNPPTFDPMLGFPEGRIERTVKATREDCDKAKVPLKDRDYCVDYFIDYMKCYNEYWPRMKKLCKHELHELHHCKAEDDKLRIMEYERERRLKERAKRIAKQQNDEELLE